MKSVPSALLLITSVALFLGAAPTKPPSTAPNAGPKNAEGLTAVLIANKDTYALDPAQAGKDFRDSLELIKNGRGRVGGAGALTLPPPPAVDLTLRITNTTDKDVTISVGGDDSRVDLKLAGPGAVTQDHNVPMTMEFRVGQPVVIAPGKTYDTKITSLAFGMRGVSQYAYWTEAGDYTLIATLIYGTGEKQGNVKSSAAKIKVEVANAPNK